MSINNYYNKLERVLYSNPWGDFGLSDTTFGEVVLGTTFTVDVATTSENLDKVLYEPAVSNGLFRVDASNNVIIEKPGIYSISILSTFYEAIADNDTVTFDGNRKHCLDVNYSGFEKRVCYNSVRSSVNETSSATNSATTIYSNIVLPLSYETVLSHKVAAYDKNPPASPIAVIGTTAGFASASKATSVDFATKMQIVLIGS